MRLADSYDVICAGGGLSSYLCAALLAKAGRKVLVIDDEDRALPRICEDRFIFDPDFAVFNGLNDTAALGGMLRQLGLFSQEGQSLFQPLDSVTQVLTPQYRIIFWNDPEQAFREISRELPQAGRLLCDYFSLLYRAGANVRPLIEGALTLGQAGTRDSASWKKFWGRYYRALGGQHPLALRRFFPADGVAACEGISAALLGAVSFAAPVNLGCEQAIRGLSLPLQGQYYYVGGIEALKKQLGAIVTAAGGNVKQDTKIESLITESRRVSGVLLSSFEGIIRAETVVLSSRLKRLYATLSPEIQDPTVLRALNRVEPTSWRFTLSVTVKSNVIPIGLTASMAYVGSFQYPLEEDNYLRIQTVAEGTYEGVAAQKEGFTTILATALVPYKASAMDYPYLRRLSGKMLRAVSELVPFLEDNIVGIHPDFRTGEAELREFYPFKGTDWIPPNLMQYYIRGHRAAQDFWGPSWTTPHQNLYFTGRSIWPALGTYGEALAAKKIFDDIIRPGSH